MAWRVVICWKIDRAIETGLQTLSDKRRHLVGRETKFKNAVCARIVPEDVGSGDLSDSVDCRICKLRVSNFG